MIIEEDLNQGGKIDKLERMLNNVVRRGKDSEMVNKASVLLKDIPILREINNTSFKQLKKNNIELKDAKKRLKKIINDYKLFVKFSNSRKEELKSLGAIGASALLGQILGGPMVGAIMATPVGIKAGMNMEKGEELQNSFNRVKGRTSFLREEYDWFNY